MTDETDTIRKELHLPKKLYEEVLEYFEKEGFIQGTEERPYGFATGVTRVLRLFVEHQIPLRPLDPLQKGKAIESLPEELSELLEKLNRKMTSMAQEIRDLKRSVTLDDVRRESVTYVAVVHKIKEIIKENRKMSKKDLEAKIIKEYPQFEPYLRPGEYWVVSAIEMAFQELELEE